jgi:molecular chaperone GrpE
LAKAKKSEASEDRPLDAEVVDVAVDETQAQEASPQNELETALAAEKDKYLRLAAEYDNYRKRSIKERESLYADIRSDTIVRMLPVYDNLSRALKLECSDEAFYKGVEMTMTQLKDILDKLGVTEIPTVGTKFDPERHNAVMHIEDPEVGEGIIVEEFEKGFMLGDKVIRFSMVKVAN